MFQLILVPLDGSHRVVSAIPVAACIARASNGTIVLLRAVTSSPFIHMAPNGNCWENRTSG